ncbi:glutathione S-transferase family protein [Shewanella japonica]|uniref:glutathione S-transferase family protein n=1 Tax=Shewanella japonica TaxID=93973 RepID=UPI000E738F6E|nr:glutathione S-transferase family protein [Shewanella japonica]
MALTLFYAPGACSGVTINAIQELGLECDFKRINLASGEQKSPEYLQINPFGKVPALVTEGKLLTENPAILLYLNSLVPGSKLLPETEDEYQKCVYASDLMWFSSTVHPSVRHVCMPAYYTVSKDVCDVVASGRNMLTSHFEKAEKRLKASNWWYGEQWSIVDVYLHWCYTRALRGGFSLDDFPALLAHQKRVESKPSFQRRLAIEQSQ